MGPCETSLPFLRSHCPKEHNLQCTYCFLMPYWVLLRLASTCATVCTNVVSSSGTDCTVLPVCTNTGIAAPLLQPGFLVFHFIEIISTLHEPSRTSKNNYPTRERSRFNLNVMVDIEEEGDKISFFRLVLVSRRKNIITWTMEFQYCTGIQICKGGTSSGEGIFLAL